MFDVSATLNPASSATSLGSRLAALREKKGLPLEQAARETRIRAQRLREIESDDLSHFSHPSYARLFLVDYAKYLGLPMEEIRGCLPAPGACGSEGYQYLQDEGPRPVHRRIRRAPQPRRIVRAIVVSVAGLVLLFCSIGGIYFANQIKRLNLKEGDHEALALPNNLPPAAASSPAAAPVAADSGEVKPVPAENSTAVPPTTAPPTASSESTPAPLYVGSAIDHGNAVQ